MMRGIHPGLVDSRRVGIDGDVLLDQAEMRTGISGAVGQFRLAVIAVGNRAVLRHA